MDRIGPVMPEGTVTLLNGERFPRRLKLFYIGRDGTVTRHTLDVPASTSPERGQVQIGEAQAEALEIAARGRRQITRIKGEVSGSVRRRDEVRDQDGNVMGNVEAVHGDSIDLAVEQEPLLGDHLSTSSGGQVRSLEKHSISPRIRPDRYTARILGTGAGIRIQPDQLRERADQVKHGRLSMREIADRRDAISIAKWVAWSNEEVAEALGVDVDQASPEELDRLREETAKRNRDLIGKMFDEARHTHAKNALRNRLTPKQRYERGLIDEDEFKRLNDERAARRVGMTQQGDSATSVKRAKAERAIAIVRRMDPNQPTGETGATNFADLLEIYRSEDRSTVREAAFNRLLEGVDEDGNPLDEATIKEWAESQR